MRIDCLARHSGDEVLAVVNAGGGAFRETNNGYRLTLKEATPRAAWFSNRPARAAGFYSIHELDDVFFDDGDPPNAALEVFARWAAGDVVVEVANPR